MGAIKSRAPSKEYDDGYDRIFRKDEGTKKSLDEQQLEKLYHDTLNPIEEQETK